VTELSNYEIRHCRYVPLVRNLKVCWAIGFFLLVLSIIIARTTFGKGSVEVIVAITAFAWMLSVFLTDKYVHKYPQRYFTYLVASHLKAAITMGFFLWIMGRIAGPIAAPRNVLWTGYVFFIFFDALASVLCRRDFPFHQSSDVISCARTEDVADSKSRDLTSANKRSSSVDKQSILNKIRFDIDKPLVDFITNALPDLQGDNEDVLVLDDIPETYNQAAPVSLLIGRTRINDIRRLNLFLMFCAKCITEGGFIIVRYMPLESLIKNFKRRYKGLRYWMIFILHFVWYRAIPKIPWLGSLYFSPPIAWLDTLHLSVVKSRNRALSKAEVWGRLAFYGMDVIAESSSDGEIYVIAQRNQTPVHKKKPSYYPVVALEKVGLDGKIIRTHKIRTMFPFSEYIQKRLYEDHGLTSTGKFADDFRLTEIGKFMRKYWLDELPQIFDWLRGDIKLVGMRATSKHFLSLYPKELYDLYVKIKPGLIPPIFDESTGGFEQIVEVELTYLKSYWEQPIRTDVRYFFRTFIDIVFRGVRSK